jgi:hypothetical protein
MNKNKKCAPSKKFYNGSCFTHDALVKIAENYNKKSKNKINLNQNKAKLVKELENRLQDKCDDHACWIRLDFVKEIDNEDILNNTFRPNGPTKKYEWLSTSHINNVVEQYQESHKNFMFLGAVPHDFEDLGILGIGDISFHEVQEKGKSKIGMVINLDNHDQNGSHWVALFTDLNNHQIYFFDSVGKKPSKRIRKFINKIAKYLYRKKYNTKLPINDIVSKLRDIDKLSKKEIKEVVKENEHLKNILYGDFDIRYNDVQHQFDNSECGVYSMNFIIRLVEGESFDSIIKNVTRDEEMNQNRKEYFINVN